MEIETQNDVDARLAFDKVNRIAKLESKISRLSYTPIAIFVCILFYVVVTEFTNLQMSIFGIIILLGAFIAVVGNASMQHAKCLVELAELKNRANHT